MLLGTLFHFLSFFIPLEGWQLIFVNFGIDKVKLIEKWQDPETTLTSPDSQWSWPRWSTNWRIDIDEGWAHEDLKEWVRIIHFFQQGKLRRDGVWVRTVQGNLVPSPFEMKKIGFQFYQNIRDYQVQVKMCLTSRGDVDLAGSLWDMSFGLSPVETRNWNGLWRWIINQILIIIDEQSLQSDEFPLDGVEVLHVEGSQTGRVQVGI